jgi:hypothetical protein
MENLKKKKETEIQNTLKGYSSRTEKAGNRISALEDEMKIKGKTEKKLLKQLKTYEVICKNSPTLSKHQT